MFLLGTFLLAGLYYSAPILCAALILGDVKYISLLLYWYVRVVRYCPGGLAHGLGLFGLPHRRVGRPPFRNGLQERHDGGAVSRAEDRVPIPP